MPNPKDLLLLILLTVPQAALSAEEWLVRKNVSNMNCYVQKATALAAPSPTVIGRFPDKVAACRAAHALFIQDDAPGKCPAFTPNTQLECKQVGVVLP